MDNVLYCVNLNENMFDTAIEHKVLIKAQRENVFDAMTTAEGLDGWFTQGSEVDRRPGGKILFNWVEWGVDKETFKAECPILEVIVPERLVFKWWSDHYTTVEMDFQTVSEGTVVLLIEQGYADTKEGRHRCLECAVGWGEALTLLKFFVEYGIRY